MKIQDIIDKFNKLTPEDIEDYNEAQTFVEENESLYHDCLYNEPMLDLSKEKVEQFLKSSLTSLLDSIEKELPKEEIIAENLRGLVSYDYLRGEKEGRNNYRQEVINIINSHK